MTILQSLNQFYGRLDKRGDAPKPGYEPVRIGFILELDGDGRPLELIDIRDRSGRKPVAQKFLMPAVARAAEIKSAFLWDKTAYVFGLIAKEERDEDGKKLIVPGEGKRTAKEHKAFVEEHREFLTDSQDAGLRALLAFLNSWAPEQWTQLNFSNEALDQNIAFRLKGQQNRIDESAEARTLITNRHGQEGGGKHAICLVKGAKATYAIKQPQFKGVTGAQSSGAPIVSFNKKAFESFGKSQGANAPVSQGAAFRYGAALNWLLDRDNNRTMRIGEATMVFWADDAEVGEETAAKVEDWFGNDLDPKDEDADALSAGKSRTELAKAAEGRAAPGADTANIKLHILALSPNAGRIAIRFWLVDTYGHLADNLAQHEADLALVPDPFGGKKPKAWALLYETAVQRKAENIPPRLGGELMQAILTGNRYPLSLLSAIVGRLRTDKQVTGARVALCKAVINRNIRNSGRNIEREGIAMALNPDSTDRAYNLGRLFAVYEYAESSVAKRNATIRDKYIGAASATPRRVFPLLMRGFETNSSILAKGEGNQRGSGVKAGKAVAQILSLFSDNIDDFPTSLRLEDQGRFFVGYYHQMAALYTKADKSDSATATDAANTQETL